MKKIVHPSDSRGRADHGWLQSYHSFSFASFYDPQKIQFGALRVLNDDRVAPGKGFGTHPHRDMEIISIPLEGDLEHKDSMGNTAVIREGDVQVMSAGTGVRHSEYNKNPDREVAFLQIWILPDTAGVEPRYDQIHLEPEDLANRWFTVLGPRGKHDGLWIHQDAWFHMGRFDAGKRPGYQLKSPGHGLYLFVLEGSVEVADTRLSARDAMGIWDIQELELDILEDSRILLMEVPMEQP
ncbi:pirin family protein [Robiginitalea sp. SC105]|uniref:pirin family protein n=1 Tax=Robiginitalea sp. SC105 TaxID=2762332 RepID=UPI00163AFC78|nr:pirin family protein [Robiginitalea sp. SC105]MBC2838973.1 pirin family protein [Robiginitalea sp. SC105]